MKWSQTGDLPLRTGTSSDLAVLYTQMINSVNGNTQKVRIYEPFSDFSRTLGI